mgnify:CR=1 FL=1
MKKSVLKFLKSSLAFIYSTYFKSGYFRSALFNKPCDRDGNPLPLLTYPFIEYIHELNLSKASMLEFGGGNSTLFFANKVNKIYSIEPNFNRPNDWFLILQKAIAESINSEKIKLFGVDLPEKYEYYPDWVKLVNQRTKKIIDRILSREKDNFDIILIDGWGFQRNWIAKYLVNSLSEGGIIVVDNTYHCPQCAHSLRELGFNQINFKGHAPSTHEDCTSIFFKGKIKFEPKSFRFPQYSFCSKKEFNPWEEEINFNK